MSWRFRFVLLFFIFLFTLITLRLMWWQIFQADVLAAIGESQYGKQIKLSPVRGEIKTSDGYSLAANRIAYRVFANPKEIKNPAVVVDSLASILQEDPASISALLNLNRYWVSLKTAVEENVRSEIEKRKISGVGFEEQSLRYYPEASTAAHLLGFVAKDENGEDTGYFGLEGYYDRQLRGKAGLAMEIHDALGRPILAKMNENTAGVNGRTITLHINRVLQFTMEKELKAGIEKYGASGGMAAMIEPATGNVLAMASFPSFDIRSYQDFTSDLYKNPFITNTYEPGSTFKPLIMASAIDAGFVKPETKCTICDGPVSIGGYQIKTWNNEYFPNISMIDVIRHSDNTGMVFVSKLLGLDRMITYLKKFGIGTLTGVDLQGEIAPELRSSENWHQIDLATASFGQGISVTPIELLSAFSSLANEGVRMEPHVVATIETPTGESLTINPKILNRTVSSKTAKIITEMLVNAVDNGEAKWAKPKGYRIAGKTGTAQIPIEGHYDPNKTIASFIGFAPADNPKFVMLVIIDRPTSSIYGAETAAPLFFSIAKKTLDYYSIPAKSD